MWYVYHLLFVVVARSWAAMSLLARSGYVVLHALGLRCLDVVTQIYAHQTTFNTERLPGVLIMARWTTEPFPTLSACPACCIRFNGSTKVLRDGAMPGVSHYNGWSRHHIAICIFFANVCPGCKPNPNLLRTSIKQLSACPALFMKIQAL